ncbi:hypothetical protein [Hymenobacter metallicola]|uniref:Uncharacterized protein n=1 Tax=Hymenobacter metallicola TaxID=2563114 RepID=A0A4Z0Q2K6_9BACT|nr:hypothetical protein [Hymenobacter metallicola]TGE22952.1 hypothetical protein E5K02_21555 [Hymenobacter metallicola]
MHSAPEQEAYFGLDIDWFAVDIQGHLIHFASGGGLVPAAVGRLPEKTILNIANYFTSLPVLTHQIQVTPEAAATGGDLSSFTQYVQRGLYSFDKTTLNQLLDTNYHLVGAPMQRITLSTLPAAVVTLIAQVTLPLPVAEVAILDTSIIQ